MFSTKTLVAKYCILSFIIFSVFLEFVPRSYAGTCSSKQSVEASGVPPQSHLKPPPQVYGDPRPTVKSKSGDKPKAVELSKPQRRRRARKAAALRGKAEERLSLDEDDSRRSPVKHVRAGWSVSSSSSDEDEMRRPPTIGTNAVSSDVSPNVSPVGSPNVNPALNPALSLETTNRQETGRQRYNPGVLRLDSAPLDDERKTVLGRRGVEIPVLNLGPLYPSRSGSECSPVYRNDVANPRHLGKTHSCR